MLAAADVRGAARQLAEHCVIAARSDGELKLILASDKAHLNTDQVRTRLESTLTSHFGRRVRLTITPGEPSVPTPAEQRKASETERMRQARESIESDPMVKGFQSAFDAVVDADTIEPIEAAEGTIR
jgi:DNA polymerase-3 subunit gamma/tau